MYALCKQWLKQKARAFKARLGMPQYAQKRRDFLIKGVLVGLLFLAVSGLYVFQYHQYEVSSALQEPENKQETPAEDATPVYIGANDYWLEPEEPVQEQASPAKPQAGQAVEAKAPAEKPQDTAAEDAVTTMAGLGWPVLPPAEGEWGKVFGYAYDDTWQDYRFHKGVDMPLGIGSNVVAVWDGEVKSISQSKNLGTVITLQHQDELQSVYIGLDVEEGLKQGDTVIAGTALGTITEAPLFEEEEGPHLHFEIWEKGKAIDPLSYLP